MTSKFMRKNDFLEKVIRPDDSYSKLRSYAFGVGAIVAIVLTLISLFQGYTGFLPEIRLRSVHLAFIIVLALLLYPPSPRLKDNKIFFFLDIILIILSVASLAYLYSIYPNLSQHAGARVTADVVFGLVLIVTLIEATRRTLGFSIPII